jgi:NAD(P)-dependent dehydrogenase (short-subunit alcohol dehydrogenase family)
MTPYAPRRIKKRRRALVTGGAVRVGRELALALAAAGMDVVIGYHRSASAARETAGDLRALGVRATALQADLADPSAARRLVAAAARFLGGLDVLVNNAALFTRTPLASTTLAQYDRLLAVNLRAPFLCAQAAARVMPPAGGHIVNVGDVAWEGAWPSYIPYAVSKAGVVALTRGLAAALRPRIAVNCVAPGAVLRPAGLPRARWRAIAGAAAPADVAAAVVFFATCPRAITGEVLGVDGGGR